MTKKKMRKTIIIGILMFYIISSGLLLLVIESSDEAKFQQTLYSIIEPDFVENAADAFEDIKAETKEESDALAKLFMHYYARQIRMYTDYPFTLAIQDRDGNLMHLSDNYIFYYYWEDSLYVSLDGYITEEIRKELKEFTKGKYHAIIDDMKVYFDGEKYIPVEFGIRGQSDYNDYKKTIKFSDYEPTKVATTLITSNTLMEIGTEFYNRNYYAELDELLNKEYDRLKDEVTEHFGTDYGTMGYSGSDGAWSGNMNVAIGEGYRLYFAFRYNSFLSTFFSDDFCTLIIEVAILFAIAGFIFYIMCMKVITKSEKLDEARNTFISGASHELKTPLAVIQNQCECIMENIAPEKNSEYVSSIYDEALRMNGIVSSLLSYSRISQLTAIKKERCNLSELLREEVRNCSKFAENNGVTIIEDIDDEIYADCNAQLMKMAIDNYLSNAVKYSVGNKVITVSLSQYKHVFTLEVMNPADKSSGAVASDIWYEFGKADKSRRRKGSSIGMGLPICKKIFELHGFGGHCRYKDGNMIFSIIGQQKN